MIVLRNKNMNVKDTAQMQYVQIVNRSAEQTNSLKSPAQGWLAMFRNALGMSGADVAARSGVIRNAVYQAHRKAQAFIRRAGLHMPLEQQSLTSEQTKMRVDNLTDDLMRNMPSDFWSVK
jgi:hypothetical protein